MKPATRTLLQSAARAATDWQPPPAAEHAAQRAAKHAAPGSTDTAEDAHVAHTRALPANAEPASGAAIEGWQRAALEARLSTDFSSVRVHTTGAAADAAEELGARAFAFGRDIAFARGEYAPTRAASQQLLAHELTHVAQQARSGKPALQFDPKKERAGIGATPPDETFIKDPGDWGSEDGFFLFDHEQAAFKGDDAALLKIVGAGTQPITVHLHCYSSGEGPADYNLNLSAHRGVAVKRALEALLPQDSRVVIFAHGESNHFGASAANRRVGVSVMPSSFTLNAGPLLNAQPTGGALTLGTTPVVPGLFPPKFTPPVDSVIKQPPGLAPPPGPLPTPRSLMDNAALTAPSALHGAPASTTGNVVDQWDAAYRKYHLFLPDQLKLGPVDFGAGAMANREISSATQQYFERNSPTQAEKSNADVGATIIKSPNLFDLLPDGKKKKKGAK